MKKLGVIVISALIGVAALPIQSLAESYRWSTNWGILDVRTSDGVVYEGSYDGGGQIWGEY